MKQSKTKMIGAWLNMNCKGGGRNVHGFNSRESTSRIVGDERIVTHHAAKNAQVRTNSDGYFEFQKTKENMEHAKKLMMKSPKDGKRMIELDDEDLQEEWLGQAEADAIVKEVQVEESTVETEYVEPKFSGKGKKPLSDAQKAAIAKMQAAKAQKLEDKKNNNE